MVQKIQKAAFKALISLTIFFFAFALVMFGNAAAEEPPEFREGEVPSVEAEKVEEGVPVFQEGEDEPAPLPNHPPIDEIPPIPMPQDTDELPPSEGPGSGIMYNAVTGETIVSPIDETPLLGGFQQGGGYSGADGGGGIEEWPMTFNDMSKIYDTGDFPWRMNVKLVMRFGSSWYVGSGTMRDGETVLTAGHCVYDYDGYGWADEIWVYPGWDGNDASCNAENYGYGHSTYFGTWTGWTDYGDLNYDVGIIGVTRAVGMLTGWFSWVYGGSCDWHLGQVYRNASYPSECCNPPGCTLHNGSDMYYWYGSFDSCPSWNRLQINTSGGCFNAGWGGMSGSGAYYIDGDTRYVHAIASTSDRSTWTRYTRQWEDWVNWNNNTFIPNVRGSNFDLQALDVNAEPANIKQGSQTTLLNHFATNPTNGSASGTWIFGVYLSTNDDISTADTILSTQSYVWNFSPMSSVWVNMAQVTIPLSTPPGDYWIGVVYDAATDGNSDNNDSDCWDAAPIHVDPLPPYIELTPTDYTFPDIQVGQCSSPAHSFTLTNTGGGTATGTVSLTGTNADQFEITSGGGSFSLGAGATKTINVRFCPTSITLKTASLLADGSNCNDDSSSLSGTGILGPEIELTPSSHDFGSILVGECSGTQSFTLQNIGGGTAAGTVSLTGTNADQFEITSGGGSFSLGAGATKTITVRFCPTSITFKSASLLADGSNCNDDSSSLLGAGTEELGKVYLKPQDSITIFCSTVDVEVWVDATGFQGGQIKLLYDSTCGDVTNWERNSTVFALGTWESDTPGEEWITFTATSPMTGTYLVGTLTIHGLCEVNDCSTPLDFVDPSKLFDQFGSEIVANWVDGTFTCTRGTCGDVAPYLDCNGIVDMGDVVLLLNYVGYPGQFDLCCGWCGDVAPCPVSNRVIDMGDVVLLLNYVGYPGQFDLCCAP